MMEPLRKERLFDLLSEWLPPEDAPHGIEDLDDPKYQDAIRQIELSREFIDAKRKDVEAPVTDDQEFEAFVKRELPYHREGEIIQFIMFCPDRVDPKWFDPAETIWQQRQQEMESALESHLRQQPLAEGWAKLQEELRRRESKVISLEEVRQRLAQSLESVKKEDLDRPVHFTLNRFSQPVPLEDIGLSYREGVYAAAGGAKFERVVISDTNVPVRVEITQFGNKTILNVIILDIQYQHGLAGLSLWDGKKEIITFLIPVGDGKGKRTLEEPDYEHFKSAPSHAQLQACLITLPSPVPQAIALTLESIRDSQIAFEVLVPMVSHSSPIVRRFVICLLAILCGESSLEVVKRALNDERESVRQIAKKIVDILSHG